MSNLPRPKAYMSFNQVKFISSDPPEHFEGLVTSAMSIMWGVWFRLYGRLLMGGWRGDGLPPTQHAGMLVMVQSRGREFDRGRALRRWQTVR